MYYYQPDLFSLFSLLQIPTPFCTLLHVNPLQQQLPTKLLHKFCGLQLWVLAWQAEVVPAVGFVVVGIAVVGNVVVGLLVGFASAEVELGLTDTLGLGLRLALVV
jgi:uncharacterized protein (DUF697 family)